MSLSEEAERLSRRRARMMPFLALILITQQGAFAVAADSPRRSVDYMTLGAWLLLAGVVLAALVTGGFWLKPRPVRDLMDDDVTKANRASALALGFVLSMATAMALYVVNFVETRKLPFLVTMDLDGSIARSFGDVQLTPTSVLINKRGEVVKRYVGEPDFAELHALVDELLAES